MGGAVRGGAGPEGLGLALVEHNIRCDPEAARVVFEAGAPLTVVPLDVTTRVRATSGVPGADRRRGAPPSTTPWPGS